MKKIIALSTTAILVVLLFSCQKDFIGGSMPTEALDPFVAQAKRQFDETVKPKLINSLLQFNPLWSKSYVLTTPRHHFAEVPIFANLKRVGVRNFDRQKQLTKEEQMAIVKASFMHLIAYQDKNEKFYYNL